MTTPITIRFSIWDQAGIGLFDTEDFEELKSRIDLKNTQLLKATGSIISLDGEERKITNIDFSMAPYESGSLAIGHIVVTVE